MSVNKIIQWRETLVTLSDQYFFDLVRLYIGEITTPFNKQSLIESLSSFLRSEDNVNKIIMGLDKFDLKILSAVREVQSPTQKSLVAFFSSNYSYTVLFERLLNLEERLLLYRVGEGTSKEYAINPLLEKHLLPFLGVKNLVVREKKGSIVSSQLKVDALNLAATYNYFLQNNISVKNDGGFRKKTIQDFSKIFTSVDNEEILVDILKSFINIGLFYLEDSVLYPNKNKWVWFSKLDVISRVSFLAAGFGLKSTTEQLYKTAQTSMDFLNSLDPKDRYSSPSLKKLEFLIREKNKSLELSSSSRFFSLVLDKEEKESAEKKEDVLLSLVKLGALVEEDNLFVKNNSLNDKLNEGDSSLVISPSLSVTILPGFPLEELLDLVVFMEIKEIQVASVFDITRQSCMFAFSQGVDASSIISLLQKHTSNDIPQSVEFSINDWFKAYNDFSLDFGFVLQVEPSKILSFETSDAYGSLVKKKLSDGVYLLSAKDYESVESLFKEAGYEAAPIIKKDKKEEKFMEYPFLKKSSIDISLEASSSTKSLKAEKFTTFQKQLLEELNSLDFSKDIADVLRSRIRRKIIINKDQLVKESVRVEKTEASGVDFIGKVRLAEQAISTESLLEIGFEDESGEKRIIGNPVSIDKKEGDAIIKIFVDVEQKEYSISLGKAFVVKRIKDSIFKD